MHHRAKRKPPENNPTVFDERLRAYARRIRRATAEGHRLNLTAEDVLDAIQCASRQVTVTLLDVHGATGEQEQKLKNVAAIQDQICDAIQALRERMIFAPL